VELPGKFQRRDPILYRSDVAIWLDLGKIPCRTKICRACRDKSLQVTRLVGQDRYYPKSFVNSQFFPDMTISAILQSIVWLTKRLKQGIKLVWASPNTLLGTSIGLLGLLTGGQVQLTRNCLEFHGGFVKWLLHRLPVNPIALTLGHTILGLDANSLAVARDHEHIHVRQYERWGPFFLPTYFGFSLVAWFRGGDAYRDNPFECEAFAADKRRRTQN
jgi:hypothetical protein